VEVPLSIVQVQNAKKFYALGKTTVEAVKGVSFQIDQGDFISIAGPSGSGKSTILNMIGLIDTPTDGEVFIQGNPVSKLKDREITRLRHETIGFIFQSFNLIPVLTTRENIEFPLLLGKDNKITKERKDYIDFLIEEVGLADRQKNRPNELSGGQRQRVAIARALVTKPVIVLADEPTANLDSATGDAILQLMKKVNRDLKTTFIFSTHDAKIVELADHIIRLKDGLVTENYKAAARNGA
jgi:putative ABC transport system ATP-binding protein